MNRLLLPLVLMLNFSVFAMDKLSCLDSEISFCDDAHIISIEGDDDWVLIKEIDSLPSIDIEDYLALVWNDKYDTERARLIYDVRQAQNRISCRDRNVPVNFLSNAQLREQALAWLAQKIQKPYDQFRVFDMSDEQDTE